MHSRHKGQSAQMQTYPPVTESSGEVNLLQMQGTQAVIEPLGIAGPMNGSDVQAPWR